MFCAFPEIKHAEDWSRGGLLLGMKSAVVFSGDYHEHLLGLVSTRMLTLHLVRGETVRVQINIGEAVEDLQPLGGEIEQADRQYGFGGGFRVVAFEGHEIASP
jgi:hypothetical protein